MKPTQHAKVRSSKNFRLAPSDAASRFAAKMKRLTEDKLWRQEYEIYVDQVSFAPENERISFEAVIESCERILHALGLSV